VNVRRTAVVAEDDAGAAEATPRVAPIEYLFGPGEAAPADAGEAIRYERGALIYAVDGPVGTLKHLVIDEEMAEVKALVVRMSAKNESVLVPPDLVDRSAGDALLLNVTREQFAKGASRSPRFETRMFTRASAETVGKIIPMVFRGDARRSVAGISRNRVETAASRDALPTAPSERRSWKRLFARG
jgi:hypothetical protein